MSDAAATASRAPARLLTATLALPAPATARAMTWHSMMVCGWCTRSPANRVCSPVRAATKTSAWSASAAARAFSRAVSA